VSRSFVVSALILVGASAAILAQQSPAPQPSAPPAQAAPAPAPQAPATPPPAAQPPAAPAPTPAPAAAPGAQSPADRQRPAFRAGIDIVSLNVTVTDSASHYVTDLDEGDFSVFEDGVKQNLTFFSRRQQPIALSLLLDSSASMEQHMSTLQVAAVNFVQRLKSNDIAQVVDFDSRVEIRQNFTSNKGELQAAIEQTSAGGSTSLHNAIYIALKELRKVRAVNEEDVRRQALIVFSDGEDTSSLVSFEEVLDLAKRSETAIYAIALRGTDSQAKGFREAEFVMRTLAQETGGRAFFPIKIDDLAGVYSQIADELASQYTIGYASGNQRRDGAWRRVVVQVSRPNITPRSKKGYYAPTPR
jgi:VWFA-related protein